MIFFFNFLIKKRLKNVNYKKEEEEGFREPSLPTILFSACLEQSSQCWKEMWTETYEPSSNGKHLQMLCPLCSILFSCRQLISIWKTELGD